MAVHINRKNAIISDLMSCKTAFDKAGVRWVILGGIVLGYARYKDIMDWDTDLDIGVFGELSDDTWAVLWDALNKNGFRFPSNRSDFMCCHREVECNLEVYHKDGKFYNCFPKSTPGIKFVEKAIWHDEHPIVDFLGSDYPMPNFIENFVSSHYGSDWKTNIIKDHEQYFTNKRGGRNQALWVSSRAGKYGDLWPKILKIDDNMEIG